MYPGTKVNIVPIASAKNFEETWNSIDESVTIDAVEIILHGSIDGPKGGGVGFLYFEGDYSRVAADESVITDAAKHVKIGDLKTKRMDNLYFSSCNSANLDVKNVGNAFKNVVIANEIIGWDGGSLYDYEKNEEVKGGEGHIEYVGSYPLRSSGQPTWWKYVPRDEVLGYPTREKQGKVWIKKKVR